MTHTPITTPNLSHLPRMRGLPFLGQTVAFLRDPYGLYEEGRARHGSVFRLTVLGAPWVVLAGPDALEHVYLDRDSNFSAREGLRAFAPFFEGSLLHRDGDDHRAHRRTMQPAFRATAMQGYLARMNARAAQDLDQWPIATRTPLAPAVKRLTLAMGAEVFMGLQDPGEVARMNRLFMTQVAGTTTPVRMPLPFTGMRRGLKAKAELARFFAGLIDDRRDGAGTDLFSELCRSADVTWSDAEILDHFNFLLVAAHDATTSALVTMLWALARDPDLQARLHAEVDRLPPGPLDTEEAQTLEIIDRTYREALRMMAPSAFTARAVMRDTDWQGHRLPRGTRVVLCPGPVMMSPELWRDPQRFDPDRFAPDRAEHTRHPFAWSPFGGGAHKCIGLHFAGLQVKAVMVAILRRWSIHMAPGDDPVWRQMPTPRPANDLPLTLRPR